MATPVSLMDDQMVDMAFITQLTGLTDKWFDKLIKDGGFPAPIKMGRSSRWLKSCHERCNSDPHPTPEIRSRG
ncbi:helix-turn-helix transcriptional regulator [Escherichia coli]|uniref:helix-turn-helix transcriptional regulator n=2 Tax=Escherichia coli TaxID=562 RepID=UPI0018F89F2A|nr:Rha family transcriptional regulator [Escherichia coli]MCV4790433.1 Rha family transcriptional regulator [Escherichia coli]MCV4854505.1 Rha family transcriptional regulator [Escherichia coli]MCX9773517.1 Rha family transcriptional regulator [Escherichia coli]MDT9161023.1 Rha family transcriptional regulator [Escherichia coli]UND41781.1 Rha family transcriptional regulator [Escherichia coli]